MVQWIKSTRELEMTERTRMHFVIKGDVTGKPWIVLEPYVEYLNVLERGLLGFDLADMSGDEAERFAELLNDKITGVSYTVVPGWGDETEA